MRPAFAIAAAVLLLAVAAAFAAPASLLDRQLSAMSEGRLRIADAAGTVWDGSGTLVVLPFGARTPLDWHLDKLALFKSRLSGTLGRGSAQSPPSAFDVAADEFSVRGLSLSLPAEALMRAAGAPSLLSVTGGMVNAHADAFAMRHGMFEGGFVATWQGASLPGPRPEARLSLGDVRLDAAASGTEIKGVLSNTGGDIDISGTVTLGATAAGSRVSVLLKPRAGIDPERSRAIQTALSMIGAASDSGGYRVVWQAPRQ
jgi:general secretion pathway protein N